MYAIQNIKTGEFLCDIFVDDLDLEPVKRYTSPKEMLVYRSLIRAKEDFRIGECGSDYRIVKLKIEVAQVIDFDTKNSYDFNIDEEPLDK